MHQADAAVRSTIVRLAVVMAIASGSVSALAVPARAAAGTLTTFAGGVGWGSATDVAQSPVGVGMLGDRVLAVDGYSSATELPGIGGHYPTVVRAIDVDTGLESVVGGHDVGGFSADGSPAFGSSLSGARTAVGDAFGNVYLSDNNRVRKITSSGIITTIAGTGTPGFSGDGGPATVAELHGPQGIALASDGSIVFSDEGNHRIRRIAANGVITTIAGNGTIGSGGDGGPAVLAQLYSPRDLGYDARGNLYIGDALADRIRMVTPSGIITTFALTGFPRGMAVMGIGRVLVTHGNTIRSIDATGTVTVFAGTENVAGFTGDGGPATQARLSDPRGVTVDRAGTVYVADSGNKRVRMVDTAGVIHTIAGNGSVTFGGDGGQALAARLSYPGIVRTGPHGTYIADANERVRHVEPTGVIRTIRESNPSGMAVDGAGNLYLSEWPRVVKRTPDGAVTVVAGNGDPDSPSGDGGSATSAGLSPGPLAVDGSGNLYIVDRQSDHNRIRRVDASGVITTVAGAEPVGEPYGYPRAALHAPVDGVVDMAVGPDGALYLLFTGSVLRMSCGVASRLAVDPGINWDYLGYGAQDLAIDRAGNLFISVGTRVYRIAPGGQATTVAGGGSAPVADGQPATAAGLRPPLSSVAVAASGSLYVTNVNRVLEVAGVSAGPATPGPRCDDSPQPVVPGAPYHPVTPARVLDTRNGTGGFSTPVGPGATIAVPIAGNGGVPATGAAAVVLNVTITQPTAETFLTVFPSGTTRPLASNLNSRASKTVPSLVVAKVGADGKVAVYNNAGTSHVIVDVTGWFSDTTGPPGARFSPLASARVLDTRNGTGGVSAPVAPAGTISPTVAGVGGVPATGITAVALNVTVTQPTAAESFLTVFPSGAARPLASNLNFVAGQTVPNMVMAKVGAEGRVSIYNNAGTSHVIIDVVGWFGPSGADAGAGYHALSPSRILDTRNGTGGSSAPVAPAGTISPTVAGVGGVPAVGASAVVLSVTVTQPTAAEGFVIVFPSGTARPLASNLNFTAGQTVPNLVVAKVGTDGKVSIYNNLGTSHVIFDVVGWYSG